MSSPDHRSAWRAVLPAPPALVSPTGPPRIMQELNFAVLGLINGEIMPRLNLAVMGLVAVGYW
ncbi:MAG: hypothetical protein FWD29_03505 [Micrococcales bacterium]|nr:hypothetical protein [Micrococcales bacterium]